MIEPQTAVNNAFRYFNDLLGPSAKDPMLEEVEMTKDRKRWVVTIGFNVLESQPLTPLEAVMLKDKGVPVLERTTLRRRYRTLLVNAADGTVEAMKAKDR